MFKNLRRSRVRHIEDSKKEDESINSPILCNTLTTVSSTASKLFTYEYNDGENYEIVYDTFGEDPYAVLKVRHFDFIPRPEKNDDVVIIVEASTVSMEDCKMRCGLWKSAPVPLPNTPGFDCVGKVLYSRSETVKPGDRVASFLLCGGNARYITIPAGKLVKVPNDIDAAQAVCLIRIYVMAFQSLFYGITNIEHRYKPEALKGKQVLVTAGAGLVGEAVINLALASGCQVVYATANEKHHDIIKSLGAIPLNLKPEEWLPLVEGNIDIVIDGVCSDFYKSPRAAVKADVGKLICIGMASHANENGYIPEYMEVAVKICSFFMTRTYFLKLTDSWEHNSKQCMDDLEFLLKLLQEYKIAPKIAGRIPLRTVAYAHEKLQNDRVDGFIVCEPWLK